MINSNILMILAGLIGFLAVTAQTLLARELLNVFSGNELTYGLTIFFWLLFYALGSAGLGWVTDKLKHKTFLFFVLLAAALLLIPLDIILIRNLRALFNIPSGLIIQPALIVLFMIISLAPFTILSGFLFALASKLINNIRRVYIAEAIGALLGGLLCTFIIFNLGLFPNDSPYGRITASQTDGYLNFYENGGFLFSTADRLGAEEVTHLALLQHADPKTVLLLGGGLGGVLGELVKYPLTRIDYVELDSKLIEKAGNLIPKDPRLNVFRQDGAAFTAKTPRQYDLIIINLPPPATANLNRFYTLEFFELCRTKLSAGGVLALHQETSESYLGKELILLNRSVNKTLAETFKHTLVIPGIYNYFYGSDSTLTNSWKILAARWRARKIRTQYFNAEALYYILWSNKLDFMREAIKSDERTPVNTTFKPVAYYYQLLLWSSYFQFPLAGLTAIDPWLIIAAILLLSLFSRLLLKQTVRLPIIIACLGFIGMSVQMIIIYTFQSLYGYLYQQIGLLTAVFMAGLAAGAVMAGKIGSPDKGLRLNVLAMTLYLASLTIGLKYIPLYLASFLAALPVGLAFTLVLKLMKEAAPKRGKLAGLLYGADLFGSSLAAIVTTIILIPTVGLSGVLLFITIFALAALLLI
ncbi:MAG: hypothetical protein PHH60_00285 [Candidatus Margulisbacteria bacterium]|nr:hypothetical protein [Candidatus Margulisiibacteriota bacterium]